MTDTKLIYMDNMDGVYTKEFDATVVESQGSECVLDASAFYPEGGGQPSDIGFLILPSGEEAKVMRVFRKGRIWHSLDKPAPPVGSKVHGILDWELRHAHMRMHTAQHIISGIIYDKYEARTVGNQIHKNRSRLDFAPFKPSEEILKEIEKLTNEVIAAAIPVDIAFEERASFEKRSDAMRSNLDLIPPSVRTLRIIKIGSIDECPCGGTHVRNTSEIGRLTIADTENKGAERTRVTFELGR